MGTVARSGDNLGAQLRDQLLRLLILGNLNDGPLLRLNGNHYGVLHYQD